MLLSDSHSKRNRCVGTPHEWAEFCQGGRPLNIIFQHVCADGQDVFIDWLQNTWLKLCRTVWILCGNIQPYVCISTGLPESRVHLQQTCTPVMSAGALLLLLMAWYILGCILPEIVAGHYSGIVVLALFSWNCLTFKSQTNLPCLAWTVDCSHWCFSCAVWLLLAVSGCSTCLRCCVELRAYKNCCHWLWKLAEPCHLVTCNERML